ncbi:MAG: 2'-5' RNA ligase family protein [Phycisphaerae bacterium]
MKNRTHNTAIVIIPPDDAWHPIQGIRQKHDRKVRRWMPHMTLIYPFYPRSDFERAAKELAPVCREIRPFDVKLATFRTFRHGKGYYTVWLAPEPEEPLAARSREASGSDQSCGGRMFDAAGGS